MSIKTIEVSDPHGEGRPDARFRVYGGAKNVQRGCYWLKRRATLVLNAGPASVQIYPTAAELRELAAGLIAAAEVVESFDDDAWFAADDAAAAAEKAVEQGADKGGRTCA